ncbi:hypothetical protein NE241_12915 [Klebsiella pneumoniae]|nr:hypothetical protein NE241_20200 [Klebsiella pneumoniae]USC58506.1 hypothetical protein NE241_12915 [Klebsiella pneumoniae]
MKILVLEFLKKHWLACILIAAAAVAGMNIGRIAEEHRKDENLQAAQKENARLNTRVTELNELRRHEAEEKAATLAEAWRKQADIERERDQLARELQQKKDELEKKKMNSKRRLAMRLKVMWALPVLALAGCASTTAPSVTPVITVCKRPPAELLDVSGKPPAAEADSPLQAY